MYTPQKIKQEFIDSGLKPSSANSYGNSLSVISRKMSEDGLDVLKTPTVKWFSEEKFDKAFRNLKGTSKRNYLSAVVSWMKIHGEEDTPLFQVLGRERDELNGAYNRLIEKGVKTPYEESLWVEAEELGDLFEHKVLPFLRRMKFDATKRRPLEVDEYDKGEHIKLRDNIILAVYLYPFYDPESNFGVLRNDIVNIKYRPLRGKNIKLPDEEENYFISKPNDGYFIMRDYKTYRSHGELRIDLPKFISSILRKWAVFMDIKDGGVLFPDLKKHNVTQILQRMLNKLTHKAISTQMLRKIYISWRFGKSKDDRDETANSMMHSIETQSNNYTKK